MATKLPQYKFLYEPPDADLLDVFNKIIDQHHATNKEAKVQLPRHPLDVLAKPTVVDRRSSSDAPFLLLKFDGLKSVGRDDTVLAAHGINLWWQSSMTLFVGGVSTIPFRTQTPAQSLLITLADIGSSHVTTTLSLIHKDTPDIIVPITLGVGDWLILPPETLFSVQTTNHSFVLTMHATEPWCRTDEHYFYPANYPHLKQLNAQSSTTCRGIFGEILSVEKLIQPTEQP